MIGKTCLMLLASGMGLVCLAQSDSGQWPATEQESIEKTFTLSGQPLRLVVDNVDGSVHVRGGVGWQVHVVAHKTISARTDADLAQAKKDVKLEMTEQPGSVSVAYTAPWRCKGGDCNGCCEQRHSYQVRYDIDVQVPRQAMTLISTVLGALRLEHTDGDFDVKGVNGGIEMSDVGGSGDARTVNGSIAVQFAKNPARACNFKTVNGTIDTNFQPRLSADLLLKTFNGRVYSDFDVTPLPTDAGQAERRDGVFVYTSSRAGRVRAGEGGPQLSFETMNGSIRLRQEQH